MTGYSAIAAAYVALLVTLAAMFAVYLVDVVKLWPQRRSGVFILACALALLAFGLLVDQSTFTISNIDRALYGHRGLRLSQWIAINAPWFFVGTKASIAAGCLIHIWFKIRERWPAITLPRLVLCWAGLWAAIAVTLHELSDK